MLNSELIELLEKLQKKGIVLSADEIRAIEKFDKEKISILLSVTGGHIRNAIRVLNDSVSDNKELRRIVAAIESADNIKAEELAVLIATNQKIINSIPDGLDKLVAKVAEAKELNVYYTQIAIYIVFDFCFDLTDIVEIASQIGKANSFQQAAIACKLLKNKDFIESGKEVQLITPIVQAKDKKCADTAATLALMPEFLKHDDAYEIINVIANTNNEEKADYAKQYAEKSLDDENLLEIVKVIANAKSEKRAEYAYDVATDEDVIMYDKQLPLARSVANARSDKRAVFAREVAWDTKLLSLDTAEKCTKLIAQAKGDLQAELGSKLATAFGLGKDDIPMLKMITNANEITAEIKEEIININNLTAAGEIFDNVEEMNGEVANNIIGVLFDEHKYLPFIDYYNDNPKEALTALKQMTKTFNQEFDTAKTYVKKIGE